MKAIILSIGDELVLGQTVDTNSAYLSAELVAMGIGTLYHQTVADDLDMIVKAIDGAARSAELVVISGGLGPTEDDLTREALARAMSVPLVLHEPSVEAIRAMFSRRNREMPDRNKVQALHPQGSEVIPNTCGTAPGLHAKLHKADIFVTPGVPSEMFAMWRLSVRPGVEKLGTGTRDAILTAKVNTFGIGESNLADQLAGLMDRKRNPLVGTTVAGGVVSVRVRSEFPDALRAQAELDDTLAQVESRLGALVYGRGEQTLQDSLVQLLKAKKQSLATAESCTGGLIGKMVTDIAGSSVVFKGGWVTYSNDMKMSQLGVGEKTLREHGAVSAPTAREMAQAALERSGADWAVSATGIAGPDGGTPEKPVGLVFAGIARRGGPVIVLQLQLSGDRDMIRDRAAKSVLQALRFRLLDADLKAIQWAKSV